MPATEARRVGGHSLLGGGSHLQVEAVLVQIGIHLPSPTRVISSVIVISYQSWLLEIIDTLERGLGQSAVIHREALLHSWH